MAVQQLSIFLENRPGTLLEALTVLGDAKVDLRALCVADTTDFGVLRVIVSDTEKALAALREHSIPSARTQVTAVEMQDKPGALQGILKVLDEAGTSVEYSYAFLTPQQGRACCAIKTSDSAVAEDALRRAGIPLAENL